MYVLVSTEVESIQLYVVISLLATMYQMDYVRDGKIQGQCTFKKTKELPCISPSLT